MIDRSRASSLPLGVLVFVSACVLAYVFIYLVELACKRLWRAWRARRVPIPDFQPAPLGLISKSPVMPGETTTVDSRPRLPFQARRIVVPGDVASAFRVLDVQVDGVSVVPTSGSPYFPGVPAELFDVDKPDVPSLISFPLLPKDRPFTMIVKNVSPAPLPFTAAVLGLADFGGSDD